MKRSVVLSALFTVLSIANAFFTSVPTGNVVAWYKWNVLQENMGYPGGLHFFNPLTTSYEIVDVTSQMDPVEQITCLTLDKQQVTFPSIKVWNKLPDEHVYKVLKVFEKPTQGIPYDKPLIYDPVINFIKETCSEYTGEQLRHDNYKSLNEMVKVYLQSFQENRTDIDGESTGIFIINVFVEIPRLAPEVEANYQEIAVQKTAKQAEAYRQETEMKRKETANKLEELEAEKKLTVAATQNKQSIEKNEADAKISKIKADSDAEQKRIAADADSYANHKKATDNEKLLTKSYLLQLQLESFGCQNVIHYGNLPDFLPSPLTVKSKD